MCTQNFYELGGGGKGQISPVKIGLSWPWSSSTCISELQEGARRDVLWEVRRPRRRDDWLQEEEEEEADMEPSR